MEFQVRRLTPALREDFYRVHSPQHDCGWCCCVAWWVPTWEGWGGRSAGENRALRDALFDRGEYDGYLGYVNDVPAAWCQVGRRDRLEKLTRQLDLAADPSVWAITCFLVAPACRRHGLAQRMLVEVLADLRSLGVCRVEAYPKRGEGLEVDDLWNGPESMFRSAGFETLIDHPTRPVLSLDLCAGAA